MSPRRWLLRLLLLAGIAAGIVWAGFNRAQFDPQAFDAWLSGLGLWAPTVYIIVYAAGTVIFLPGLMFALAGGALFGPVWGTVFNLLGATLGATLAFLVARYIASDWVSRKAAGRMKRLIAGVEAEGWRFVALVRLVPLFPFNLTNYALGLTRIGLLPYVIASFICMAPGALAYTWLGHAGRAAAAGDVSSIRYGLGALGLLAAIVFLPRLIGRLRRRGIEWIEPEELHRRLDLDEAVDVLDVRGPEEFDGVLGHISGALNIPLDELGHRLDSLRSVRDGIAVVCRTDKRSATAADTLRAAGFAAVSVLRGGMVRWNTLGFRVVRGSDNEPLAAHHDGGDK